MSIMFDFLPPLQEVGFRSLRVSDLCVLCDCHITVVPSVPEMEIFTHVVAERQNVRVIDVPARVHVPAHVSVQITLAILPTADHQQINIWSCPLPEVSNSKE
jgi:hypothetical protein